MLKIINGLEIKLLGDPHLGRKFVHGVSIDRKGDRERTQWSKFETSLFDCDIVDVHVCMGDIFDKAIIPAEVLFRTAQVYKMAAKMHPNVEYVLIRGNHDGFKDIDRISSFDILAELLASCDNISVYKDPELVEISGVHLGFCPWSPVVPASELMQKIKYPVACVFGHWDTISYGGSEHNLIPTAEMASLGITEAVTGHIHLPDTFERDGVTVTVTGSMVPYSHAEDPDAELYQTVTLEEYLRAPEGAYTAMCLRIDLQPGEKIDFAIDCLQLTTRRVDDDGAVEDIDVNFGDFDFEKLFVEAFQEEDVPTDIIEIIKHKYDEMRSEDA